MASGATFGADSGVGSTIALLEARLPSVREQRRQLEDELAAVIAQEDAMISVLQGLHALSGTVLDSGSSAGQGAAATPGAREVVAEATGTVPAPDSTPEVAEVSLAGAVGEPVSRPDPAAAQPVRKRAAEKTVKSTARGAGATKQDPAGKAAAKKSAAAKSVPAGEATGAAVTVPSAAKPTTVAKKGAARGAGKATAKKAAAEKSAPAKKTATARKVVARKTAAAADKPALAKEGPASVPAAPSGRHRKLTDATSVLAVLAGASGPLRAREVTGLLGLDDQDASVNAVRTMLERLAKTGKAQRSGRGLYVAQAV
ncbi:hypothetical protein [Kitasatospora indigofera]|uniref:hypothetical protein n=1 Tax=Kitasatospora indigofera TaxID=67307 RepID=UPI0033B0901C